METVLIVLAVGTLNIVCFFIGIKAGKKEDIQAPELPNLNPFKAYQEHVEKKKLSEEQRKLETILENIDNYNGTSYRQKDV